jgi:hypothetical protein
MLDRGYQLVLNTTIESHAMLAKKLTNARGWKVDEDGLTIKVEPVSDSIRSNDDLLPHQRELINKLRDGVL